MATETSTNDPYESARHAAAEESASAIRAPKPPRMWPAVALVAGYWAVIFIARLLVPNVISQLQHFLTVFYSPFILALGIIVWWLFFSRQPWMDRLFGLGLLIASGIATRFLSHKSMAFALMLDAIPMAVTIVVLTAVVTYALPRQTRWTALALASVLSWGYYTLLRFDGVTGNLTAERSWRWSPTAEDNFLQERKAKSPTTTAEQSAVPATLVATDSDWTGFRGPQRDGHVLNMAIGSDWTKQPPKQLWQRRIGPGWSSFAVVGNLGFTQEQRGKKEAVVAFDINTGDEIWAHEDEARFEETVSGTGPRATPTFDSGKIYAQGGSGILNCLDAVTGKLLWSHDITEDASAKPDGTTAKPDGNTGKPDGNTAKPDVKTTKAEAEKVKPPGWGYSSSPLVVQGVVVAFAGGKDGKGLLAYDASTGELKWTASKGIHTYSSPQLAKFGGEDQILFVSDFGLEALQPATGKILWEHDWSMKEMFRCVQPHIAGDGLVLIGTPLSNGTRMIQVSKQGEDWKAEEKWRSMDLKPYFNDCVQLGDYIYGFDNDILVCIDVATGKKKWKKGRYGSGQVLLIGDQGQMLVISEEGNAVLTDVSPKGLEERSRFKALEGKTWNHPVIAGNKLLVRNSEQMACYELVPTTAIALK